MTPLYFDNNATTPLDPRVLEAMLPFFTEHFGNAESSQHAFGWKAKLVVDRAREQVAALLNSAPTEIIFTSGATESMNLAILGALENMPGGRHLISSQAEHKATLEICARARRLGHEVTLLPVNRYGQIEPSMIAAALQPNTSIVSLLHANNEIGTITDIAAIGALLREKNVLFHVDAAQTAGKEPIDVQTMKIDLLSISAHKFYGPKGSGALYVRRPEVHLAPVLFGGGQERGLRSGTHNVPGIVGLGLACELAQAEMSEESARLRSLRDLLISRLVSSENGIELNGHPTERVCNNVHFSIRGIGSDRLVAGLSDIAFSMASACSAGGESHVLKSIGRAGNDPLVSSTRFGLGRFTKTEHVEHLIGRILAVIQNERAVTKSYDTSNAAVPKNAKIR
jgi:cysteine desulfurase